MNVFYKNKVLLKDISLANNFWSKLSGYMFRKAPHVSGILFFTSGSMQTTFMRFSLDIIFLNSEDRIVKVLRGVRPWRFTKSYKGTKTVLEVPVGVIPASLTEGEKISFLE